MAVSLTRPRDIQWAVILVLINAVGGFIATFALPDVDDRGTFIVVGGIISLVLLATAWFLWQGNRWGSIAAIVANALNILLCIPAFFDPDPASLAVGAAVSMVLSIGTIFFALTPSARAFWNTRAAVPATA
jgi:hypothetical protein